MLTNEQVETLKSWDIPVTTGCRADLTILFSRNPVVTLDQSSVMPDENEAALIRAERDFTVRRLFGEKESNDILAEFPFRAVGFNTRIYLKTPAGWQYRQVTWIEDWSPAQPTLPDLLRHANRLRAAEFEELLKTLNAHTEG